MNSTVIIALISCALAAICTGHGTQSHQQVRPGSYTDTLLRGLRKLAERARSEGIIDALTNRQCNLVCPITTVCSLQFGFPRCVPIYRRLAIADSYYYNQPLYQPFAHGQVDLSGALTMLSNLNGPLTTADAPFAENHPSLVQGQASISGGFTASGKTTIPVTTEEANYNNVISSQGHDLTVLSGDETAIIPGKIENAVTATTVDNHHDEPAVPSSTHSLSDVVNALTLARRTDGYQPAVGRTSDSVSFNVGIGLNDCGFVPPECRAITDELNTSIKYTFDYTVNRCVRVNVCTSCALLNGLRYNLFNSLFDCNRFCQ